MSPDTTARSATIPVFDGHNDTLQREMRTPGAFLHGEGVGHIDLQRARTGGLAGGFCAVSVSPRGSGGGEFTEERARALMAAFGDESTMPPTPDLDFAQEYAFGLMSALFRLERESDGQVKVIRTADELQTCIDTGVFAALLHMEGAEPIDADLNALEVFYQAGLRSIGPVWSRPNVFGRGVPFRFPQSPDTGPGLTDAGKAMVRMCNRLRILVDLSHLNEKGFWDVAALTDAPLVATHSNAHAVTPSARNLTDKQLDAIKESDGMVGINYHVGFIRRDGQIDSDTPLDAMVDHIDYLVARIGIDRVGLGSDFDGSIIPKALGDCTGLPRFLDVLHGRGYDDDAIRKIAHGNWVRVLRQTWGQ